MGLMVGWRAGHMRSGEEWAIVSGRIIGSWWSWEHEWPSGVICVSLGVGVDELASEGRGEEGEDLLGWGWVCVGMTWQRGGMSGCGASLVFL